ncbi:DNA (cytosine-5-)-methyltransferase [Porphyromonas sp. COT-290 OH3588]|uniref:DNA (cytosine-5-)-methyltransferase n=1 Tax=Porphyromonas sp. COT-290 OH3588 TaxID=1515617 RepID=UPI0005C76970|nr:DNA (cytosine-5-)-methyltransferase [Porphyromonas sp. COT-290 OH3588]
MAKSLFKEEAVVLNGGDIRIIELFAGVGGFRIGFEKASSRFKTVWNNQWEPSTKRQDASIIYCNRFGSLGHVNEDITSIPSGEIPEADLLCGGFPCQDYSVATTLSNSKGIEGKKGVLWWQIQRILEEKGAGAPNYLVLENVDRLLSSPAQQRGRDFAIILASLSDLGYIVEWRVVNAAEYGMPQRRKRTYIIAYREVSPTAQSWGQEGDSPYQWILNRGILARALPCVHHTRRTKQSTFKVLGSLINITQEFNKTKELGKKNSTPFGNAGVMSRRQVWTLDVESSYDGSFTTLGELLVDEVEVPEPFFISEEDLPKWIYLKGGKNQKRVTKDGYEYNYSEGSMVFPDALDKPSRTIITGEGGASPSRVKHIVKTPSGRYRRLLPVELERLNMFPDYHTQGVSDIRRAFLMGNALVTGVVERIGRVLIEEL